MSVYNGADYLEDAIISILRQSYARFEFIIIDDGSQDQTWEILKSYSFSEPRIQLLKNQKNIGLTRSLNKGLRIAKGKYIARQDHDDLSCPERLEKQVLYMEKYKSTALVSCNYSIIDHKGRYLRETSLSPDHPIIKWNLIFYNYLGGHSQVMFRRELFNRIGGYDESYRYAQDYDLWIRISKLGKIRILPEVLLKHRIHDNRITSMAGDQQLEFVLMASALRIYDLTRIKLDLYEVKNIWSFWCMVYQSAKFNTNMSTTINLLIIIRKIYTAFIEEQSQNNGTALNKSEIIKIRYCVVQRCLKWLLFELTKRHHFGNAIVILIALFYWFKTDLFLLEIKRYILCKINSTDRIETR